MESLAQAIDLARDWAFPVSGLLLCLYPVAILLWTVVEGRLAAAAAVRKAQSCDDFARNPKSMEEDTSSFVAATKEATKADVGLEKRGRNRGAVLALAIAAVAAVVSVGAGVGFACSAGGARQDAPPTSGAAGPAPPSPGSIPAAGGWSAEGAAMGAALLVGATVAGLVAAARIHSTSRGDGAERGVPRYVPPPPTGYSLWHDVNLKINSGEDGLFHYVNEMPKGCLQKFEVQPGLPDNAVEEDPKGSRKLAAFGQPVPFNYGCFPQTYRDPNCKDAIYGAPGDDDPLDVLDLATGVVGVGKVVRCRPLGAVCLIDEGQADWKILAVNVDSQEPLAQARSIEEVNQIAPGRISECLQWIDDFKNSGGKCEAHLDFQIHDVSTAHRLISEDHACWQKLLKEAGSGNIARGHWVRAPRRFTIPHNLPHPETPLLGRWPTPVLFPQQTLRLPTPWPLVGAASPAMAASRSNRTYPTLRRQECHAQNPRSSSP